MLFTYQYNHSRQKKNRRLPLFPAVLVSLVMAVSLLSGCSGTGTMYNPNAVEDDSDLSGTGASTAVMSSGSTASGAEGMLLSLFPKRNPAPSGLIWKEPEAIFIQEIP